MAVITPISAVITLILVLAVIALVLMLVVITPILPLILTLLLIAIVLIQRLRHRGRGKHQQCATDHPHIPLLAHDSSPLGMTRTGERFLP